MCTHSKCFLWRNKKSTNTFFLVEKVSYLAKKGFKPMTSKTAYVAEELLENNLVINLG